jgi:hypothetical protein
MVTTSGDAKLIALAHSVVKRFLLHAAWELSGTRRADGESFGPAHTAQRDISCREIAPQVRVLKWKAKSHVPKKNWIPWISGLNRFPDGLISFLISNRRHGPRAGSVSRLYPAKAVF